MTADRASPAGLSGWWRGDTVTDNANVTPAPTASTPRQRARADAILRVLATITLIGVGVQFLLAGAGAFGEGFDPHAVLGRALGWWTLLLVVMLVARAGRADTDLDIPRRHVVAIDRPMSVAAEGRP
jgi:hypothetical protein